MSWHVPQHTFRCPPPPPCHGGTAGRGDRGETSANHPRTRTIALAIANHQEVVRPTATTNQEQGVVRLTAIANRE